MTRRSFHFIGTAIGTVIVIVAFTYWTYQASPPRLEVRGLRVDDFEGLPSVIIDFSTDKYGIVFKLFDEEGHLMDVAMPAQGASRVALSLVGLKPYTVITESKTYVIRAFYRDCELFSRTITVKGASMRVRPLGCTVESTASGLKLESLIIEVENTGDVPLYAFDVRPVIPDLVPLLKTYINLEVRIDGEKSLISLAGEMPIIRMRPGERKELMIDLLNVTVEKPEVSIEVGIGGLKGSFKLCLEACLKPQ
jgi:hypothetical protein